MTKVRITLIKSNNVLSKPIRLIQKNIYNSLCKKIFKDSDNDCKNWTKEQWDDPHKVYEVEDTPEKCKEAYNKWVYMKAETWHDIKIKVKESRGFRFLPRRMRNFLISAKDNDSKYYDKFINFLAIIGIFFEIELVEQC